MIYCVVSLMFHGRGHAKIRQNVLVSNILTKHFLYQTEVQVFTTEPKRSRPRYEMEGALQEQFSVMGLMKKLTVEIFYPSFCLGDLIT